MSHLDTTRTSTAESLPVRTPSRNVWKSFDEQVGSAPFRQYVEREHPGLLEQVDDPVGRRDLFRLLGASVALAGFARDGLGRRVIPHSPFRTPSTNWRSCARWKLHRLKPDTITRGLFCPW